MATTPKRYDDPLPPASPNVEEGEIRHRPRPLPIHTTKKHTTVRRIERHLLVEQMMISGYTTSVIAHEVSSRFNCTPRTVKEDITSIRKRWDQEDAEDEAYYRPNAIRRIQKHIRDAKAKEAWSAVASFEKLLAQMQGTLEPVSVNVQFVANQALADYISNLSDKELDELNEEQEDIERKARLFEQAAIIDTEGTEIL